MEDLPRANGEPPPEEGRKPVRRGVAEEDRKDRQALGVVVGTEIAAQSDLSLGPDPAPHPVAAHQHDEAIAGIHRFLQAVEPELTLPDALLVPEHGKTVPIQLTAKVDGRIQVVTAVAQEDVMVACESSCVDCLQTFRNTYYHKHLDRKLASERLNAWGPRLAEPHDIPPKQPSQEPREGSQPVNEAERKLRHLLLAAGFEEGVRGEQLRLDRAIGTTTPDVIYRADHHDDDEGI